MMQFRDLSAQYRELQPRIDKAVIDVMASGRFIGGEPVRQLEQQLAEYVGVKHCVTCGNGTDALQIALMAWNVGPGDAVIVPDFTFFSSGEVVSAVGATPVFVDVDERTFNIDPRQIEPAYNLAKEKGLHPKAVVAVDLFGLPASYPVLRPLCDELGLLILEDGAQGFGGSIDGKMVCSFGDISTTSFFPAKPLGCYGDGGAIFTDNDEWADLVRSYAVHGKGSMKYDNVRIGMNSRLDTIQAAILQVKLNAFIDEEMDAVNRIAESYNALLAATPLILPCIPSGYVSSWAQYTIQLPAEVERGALRSILENAGIPTMVYYPKPMHLQIAFSGRGLCATKCSNAMRLCSSVLSLPMSPYLSADEVEYVARSLSREFF